MYDTRLSWMCTVAWTRDPTHRGLGNARPQVPAYPLELIAKLCIPYRTRSSFIVSRLEFQCFYVPQARMARSRAGLDATERCEMGPILF